jgi:hypothetical protein
MIDHPAPALAAAAHPAFHRQPRHRGDGGQGLAPETKGGDQLDRLIRQLGGGMALQRQRHIVAGHAAAVVGHLNAIQTALRQRNGDLTRSGVDGVLHQLFQGRGGALHHLASGNAVDQRIGQAANDGHGRHRASIVDCVAKGTAAKSAFHHGTRDMVENL